MSRSTQPKLESPTNSSGDSDRRGPDRTWEHRFVWLLLFAILAMSGYFLFIGRVDDKLTKEILKHLRKELPGHQVFVDRAELKVGKSITIEGIRIAKPTDQGSRDVIRCGRLVCHGPIEIIGLVQGQVPIQSVVADGVELCVWPLSDGRMSIQEISSSKPISPAFPNVEIRSGLIRLGNETGKTEQEIICHDLRVNAGLMPRMVDGKVMPLAMKVTASLSSSFFSNANILASISENKRSWSLQGQVAKFEYSQRLADQLPLTFQTQLQQIAGFSGQFNAAFAAACNGGAIEFETKSTITNGRLLHPKVPYPLESISGEVHCKNASVKLNNFRAFSGGTSVAFAGHLHGYSIGSALEASMAVQDLSLDQRLFQALPAPVQETWRKLGISGKVNAQATVRFDGKNWYPKVNVQAVDAGLNPDFFPYPVKNLEGEFVYEKGTIVANQLVATAGEQTIRGALTLRQAQPRWLMDLQLSADGPIPIDDTLLKALSPRNTPPTGVHNFILSLHPTGSVLLKQGRFVRSADQPDVISRALELTFSECSIKYDSFRYPIVDMHGEVTLDNERLLLRDFKGRNDGARIKGHGICQTKNSALDTLELFIDGYDVGLDEELQLALPKNVGGLWDQLKPNGVIDQVNVEIIQKSTNSALDMKIEIVENRESESHSGRSVSIRPKSIPYQINDIACNIVYRPGRIDIKSLSGVHDASRMQTEGMCRLHSDGTWDGMLTWLPSTRLLVDQSLLECLPSYLRDPLVRMDFRGPVSVTGKTRVSSPNTPYSTRSSTVSQMELETNNDASIVRQWDLELQIEDGRLGGGGIASGIRGSLSLAGENTLNGPLAFGFLDLDALAIKGLAVTGVRGPFAFNREELLFGRDATAWQQKNNLMPPDLGLGLSHNSVVDASYINNSSDGDSVNTASFRSTVRDSFSNRPGLLNRSGVLNRTDNAPPENPNAIRTDIDLPVLDVKDNDIRARTLSGTLIVSGVEPLDSQQRARYRLRLVDADLHGFLVDLGETNTSSTGRLSVQCDLNGALTNVTSLEGQGQVWLRNANLYELPAMIRLFQLLSINPSQAAFDSADVKFTIDGDQLPIQELALDGDLVSMKGKGWVNMRRELHLDLFANVGRRGGIFRPISSASGAKFWQIEVNGTTNDPQIRHHRLLMNNLLPEGSAP